MPSSGKHIQLPFGNVRDKDKQSYIKFNLPPDYKKMFLFEQLPYLAQLDNPAITDMITNGIVDNIALKNILVQRVFWKTAFKTVWTWLCLMMEN